MYHFFNTSFLVATTTATKYMDTYIFHAAKSGIYQHFVLQNSMKSTGTRTAHELFLKIFCLQKHCWIKLPYLA